MQLTGKQKRQLRGLGHHLNPVLHIGKDGVTDALTKEAERALDAHELIKIRTLENCEDEIEAVATDLADKSSASLVQVMGRTALLYRRRKENPKIEL